MFSKGDKIHLHDGRIVKVRKAGIPKMRRGKGEHSLIRGFVRGALVDCLTGETQVGDYHENVITTAGHAMIVRNFAGIASSHSSVLATVTGDLGLARYWGLGNFTEAQSSNFSSLTTMHTEYGLTSTGAGSVNRMPLTVGSQVLSGTWTLSQSVQYASTQISHSATINCIAQYAQSSVGQAAMPALSLATFASSTKGTTQALNVTYSWVFST